MEENNVPKVSKREFIADVNNGMFKKQLAEKYTLAESSVTEITKKLGLTLKRYVAPKYILVDDTNDLEGDAQQETVNSSPLSLDDPESMN